MIIVITGPTGVGKTKLSIFLAKKYNAEVINADSVQVYRGLDIGSAKVTSDEMDGIVHHLLDIREVVDEYSLYDYQKDARECIADIIKRGKNVILVGGTGLYIKSVLYDYQLSYENTNNQYDNISTDDLYHELLSLDKNATVDAHNRRRIVRALNYYNVHHKSISDNKSGNKLLYDAIFIGLTTSSRDVLYQRINSRVDMMIKDGLVEEAKGFYEQNIYSKPLINAIGYKELYRYFDGDISYDEAIDLIKRNSRRYAKRQYTFFNNQFNIKWFSVNFNNFDVTIKEVCNYIEKNKDYISRI